MSKALDTMAMLDLGSLGDSRTANIARYLHRQMARLRTMSEGDDFGPILSRIGNAIRFLRYRGVAIQPELAFEIKGWLEKFRRRRKWPAKLLEGMLNWPPSREWYVEQLTHLGKGLRTEDIDGQLNRLAAIGRDAFVHACEIQDTKLALLTGSVLCQPVLAKRPMARGTAQDRSAHALRQFLIKGDASPPNPEQAADAQRLLTERAQLRMHTLDKPVNLGLAQVRSCLDEDEGVLILIGTGRDQTPLASLLVSKASAFFSHPQLTLPGHWTHGAFSQWEASLQWSLSDESSLNDTSPDSMIEPLVSRFSLRMTPLLRRICIIPDSELFGFPFAGSPLLQLTMPVDQTGYCELEPSGVRLGDVVSVSQVPSLEVFMRRSDNPRPHSGTWIAWSGKPIDASDDALTWIRDNMPQVLEGLDCDWRVGGSPPNLDNADVGVIIVHGQPNQSGEMAALVDGEQSISPEELGSIVGKCGCFVLAACHGGSEKTMIGSRECRGAVSSCLAAGARCVIAPCFSLTPRFVYTWVGHFLRLLANGMKAGEACDAVNRIQSSLASRMAMQVFGDAEYKACPSPPPH